MVIQRCGTPRKQIFGRTIFRSTSSARAALVVTVIGYFDVIDARVLFVVRIVISNEIATIIVISNSRVKRRKIESQCAMTRMT